MRWFVVLAVIGGCPAGPGKPADDSAAEPDLPPQVFWVSPEAGARFDEGETLWLEALVVDRETAIEDLGLRWIASVDGVLAVGSADGEGRAVLEVGGLTPVAQRLSLEVTDSAGQIVSQGVDLVFNALPAAPTVSLQPVDPTTVDDLVAVVRAGGDPDGDVVSFAYAWYQDEVRSWASTTDSFPASATQRGRSYRVEVTPWDGWAAGAAGEAEVTVLNSVPSIESIILGPDPASSDDELVCTTDGFHDADGDPAQTVLTWTVNGAAAGSGSTIEGLFGWQDEVTCRATPYDGLAEGEPLEATVTVTRAVINLSQAHAKLTGEGPEDQAGRAVSIAGDVNGDGFDDVLVGALYEDEAGTSAGAAYLVLGPVSGALDLGLADSKFTGEQGGDRLGHSVAGVGDVNGDGFGDILLGAYNEGESEEGAVYLVLGPVSGDQRMARADGKLTGVRAGENAGLAVAAAGDVTGDGLPDMLIGTYIGDGVEAYAGCAYLVRWPSLGERSLAEAEARFLGVAHGDVAGWDVASAGDVDGDGLGDVIIGAYGVSGVGAAYLLVGPVRGDLSLGDSDALLLGETAGDMAGYAVSGAGDVDADGYGDVLVGAYGSDTAGDGAGVAYLVRGPVSGEVSLAAADAVLLGAVERDCAGLEVAGGGDVNADGFDDLLIGAVNDDYRGAQGGTAYLVLGPVSGSDSLARADITLQSEGSQDHAAESLSMGGDVDGDGLADILVGAYARDVAGNRDGAAYLVYSGLLEGMP